MAIAQYTPATRVREILLILLALVWMIPFFILIAFAVKPTSEMLEDPRALPRSIDLTNLAKVWEGSAGVSLGEALLNSAIVTIGSVALLIAVGSITGYVISRREKKISGPLYALFVAGIVVPFALGMIPTYTVLRTLGMTGNFPGMWLLKLGMLLPMAVFLYTGFFRAMPRDFEEAAQMDGATRFQIFARIVVPLLRPVTATVAIMTGVMVWNDFMIQLIFLSGSGIQTVPVVLYSIAGEYVTEWNLIFAGVLVSIIPVLIVYFLFQRRFMEGFAGGVKG